MKIDGVIFKCTPRNLNVIERNRVIRELLIGFVAFAGNHHDIARLCQRDGAGNRLGAIRDLLVAVRAKSFFHFRDDRIRIFFAGVI